MVFKSDGHEAQHKVSARSKTSKSRNPLWLIDTVTRASHGSVNLYQPAIHKRQTMLTKIHFYRVPVLLACLLHGLQELLALQRRRLLSWR